MIDHRMRWANEYRSSSRASSPDTSASPFRSESPFEEEYRRNSGYDSSDSYDRPLLSPEFQTVVKAFRGMRTKSASEISEREDRFDRTPSISPPYMRPQDNPQKDPADIVALMRNPTMPQCSEAPLTSLRAHHRRITPAQPRTVDVATSPEEALVAILLVRGYVDQQPHAFADDQEYLTIGKLIDNLRLRSYADTHRRPPVQSLRSRSPGLNEMGERWQGLDKASSQSVPSDPMPATADQGSMYTFTPDQRKQKRRAQSPLHNSVPCSSRSFTCDTCGKTFGRRTLRDNHIRTHSDNRTFACSFQGCDETFKQKNEQTRHEKAQHAPKQFVCGGIISGRRWGCGKAFARRDGLQEHHTKTTKGAQCLQASSGPV
ncbi:hypothetical protein LTR15_006871 [Elasticomyces elasticus]|nr:hypothetical protein LTR15_006871 [Elasticomyces elasticus]